MAEAAVKDEEVVVEEGKEGEEGEQTPQYTESESKAIEQGWVPKDQWKGDPEDWTPAKQYLKYGDLESELKNQRKENSHLNKVVDKMKYFYSSVKDDAKKEVMDALKRSKRDALAKEDYEEVAKIDAQMDVVDEGLQRSFKKADIEVQKVATKPAGPNPEFVEWHKNNKWYKLGTNGGEDEVSKFADDLAVGYVSRNPTSDLSDVYKHVTERVKKAYPEVFENPARKQPAAVDEGGEKSSGASPKGKIKLTAEEKAVADGFGVSYEKYAEHLVTYNKRKGL